MRLRNIDLSIALSVVILILLPASAAAQVYKWVDHHGKVQYGDRPAAAKKGSEQLMISSNLPLSESASSSSWKEKDREFRKRRIERQAQAEKEQPSVSSHQLCLNARYKLQMLDGKAVYRINDKGERVYMEDAERNAIERKAQQDISTHCRG